MAKFRSPLLWWKAASLLFCAVVLSLAVRWDYPEVAIASVAVVLLFNVVALARHLVKARQNSDAPTSRSELITFDWPLAIAMCVLILPMAALLVAYQDDPQWSAMLIGTTVGTASLVTMRYTQRR
ncbi:hypothetical protein [Streptomyces sp. NPDC051286]|uniref:hypothetical protein n=1 Tax=Streptomyces sp. NPDC051286 TaxID=3365647 RepID=UPI0037BE0900